MHFTHEFNLGDSFRVSQFFYSLTYKLKNFRFFQLDLFDKSKKLYIFAELNAIYGNN